MVEYAKAPVEEEWPELGKICVKTEKSTVPAKPRNKRNWRILDDISLARPTGEIVSQPKTVNSDGAQVESRPDSVDGGNSGKSSCARSPDRERTCLVCSPTFAGYEYILAPHLPPFGSFLIYLFPFRSRYC